jgi:acetoacetyl-CoA reductase
MEGQVALVTGGARGIGLAISTRLADRGVKVAVGYSHGADTAKQFAAAHEGSTIHQGNIGVAADCERVISEVLEQHGQLDILVNNAGITIDRPSARCRWRTGTGSSTSTCPGPST